MLSIFYALIFLVSIFLILLILVQRGKGGGLAGAFGGAGGQSAFGTKAGDMFTKVTAGVACAWILLCASATWYIGHSGADFIGDDFGGQAVVEGAGDAEVGAVADEAVDSDEGAAAEGAAGDIPGGDIPGGDAPADSVPADSATAAETGATADPPPAEEGS